MKKGIIGIAIVFMSLAHAEQHLLRNETHIFDTKETKPEEKKARDLEIEFFDKNEHSQGKHTLKAGEFKCVEIGNAITSIEITDIKTQKTHTLKTGVANNDFYHGVERDWRIRNNDIARADKSSKSFQMVQTKLTPEIEGYYCTNSDVRIIRNDSKKKVTVTFKDEKGATITEKIIEHNPKYDQDFSCVLLPRSDVGAITLQFEKQAPKIIKNPDEIKHSCYKINIDETLEGFTPKKEQMNNLINSSCAAKYE